MGVLTNGTTEPARPGPQVSPQEQAVNLRSRILYLKSYLLMRAIIGFIGVSLPFLLVLGDNWLKTSGPVLRASLSDYYYSGMRDFLIASLAAAAFFLMAYKVFERTTNNILSVIAGLAVLTAAFFPTDRGDVNVPLTPLQLKLGESTVLHVHYVAAGIAFVSLAVISFVFGLQEGRRSPQRVGREARMSPTFWRWFHWILAVIILVSLAFAALSVREHMYTSYALLVGETVALEAFGLSWLFKGLELDVLLGPHSDQHHEARQVAAQNP